LTEEVLKHIDSAITAVEAELSLNGHDPDPRQLGMALAELRTMRGEAQQAVARDHSWLAQMVADQWDPRAPITSTVLGACRAFARRKSRSARSGSGDIPGH
jgi:hypothetical protein